MEENYFDGTLSSFLLDDSLKITEEDKGDNGDIKQISTSQDKVAVTYYLSTKTLRIQGDKTAPMNGLAKTIVQVINLCIYVTKMADNQ